MPLVTLAKSEWLGRGDGEGGLILCTRPTLSGLSFRSRVFERPNECRLSGGGETDDEEEEDASIFLPAEAGNKSPNEAAVEWHERDDDDTFDETGDSSFSFALATAAGCDVGCGNGGGGGRAFSDERFDDADDSEPPDADDDDDDELLLLLLLLPTSFVICAAIDAGGSDGRRDVGINSRSCAVSSTLLITAVFVPLNLSLKFKRTQKRNSI